MNPGVLQFLRARAGALLGLRLLLYVFALTGGIALAVVFLDVAFDLPEQARAIIPWLLTACALLTTVGGIWQTIKLDERGVALLLERNQPSLGNHLINAVELSAHTSRTDVEEFLRLEAVELGRKAAVGAAVWPAVRRKVGLAAGPALVVVLVWLCLFFCAGDVLQAVTPRFLDASGDHPPYSRLRIDVTPGKTEVLYGGQVEVRATVHPNTAGAEKLWLVANSETNVLKSIMFLAPDKTFFQTLANLRESTEYFVTDGRARSFRFPIRIRNTPQITLVEVTTTPPQYTGRPPHTAKLTQEPQSLPEDTRVQFRVVSNRPLKLGELSLTPVLGGKVRRISLKCEGQTNSANGEFTLTEPVVFSLSVRDIAGLDSVDPHQGRFNILPDERPRLSVLEPGRDAVATPSIRVPIRVQATDDYGITRVAWLRGLNHSIERPFAMKIVLKGGAQSVEAAASFDFDKLGVRPGDIIDYYFEAADNYPKGPNFALSRPYRIQIISDKQYEAILRQAAARKALFESYFQLNARLRRLAERARNLQKQVENGSEREKQDAIKATSALAEDLAKYDSELAKLLAQETLFDVESSFRVSLAAQQANVGRARTKLSQAIGGGQFDPKKLAEAAQELSELARTEDEDVDHPAAQIAAVAHLIARADTFVKLARQQAALVQILRRFADPGGSLSRAEQMEVQELAYQQRRIQEALHELLRSLPELLAAIPEEPQYAPLRSDVNGFVKAVSDAQIEQDLAEAANKLSALETKASYALAQQAAEKMDKLISMCNGLPQQGKLCLRFKPSVQQALGNTLAQILAAMGATSGSGQGGESGYGLFNEDVALYGPNVELAGEHAGGRREVGQAGAARAERVNAQSRDPAFKQSPVAGRVRLQPDAKFPLRYRELVGEYFRAMAESEIKPGGNQ